MIVTSKLTTSAASLLVVGFGPFLPGDTIQSFVLVSLTAVNASFWSFGVSSGMDRLDELVSDARILMGFSAGQSVEIPVWQKVTSRYRFAAVEIDSTGLHSGTQYLVCVNVRPAWSFDRRRADGPI